jgi:hypothetical protein
MTIRYLKSRKDGWIFEWDPILAQNPILYEVTEEEAYPERFIPVAAIEAVSAKRTRKKAEPVNLFTADIPEEPGYTNEALNAEASRGLPT